MSFARKRKPIVQTDRNKAGHKRALELGFVPAHPSPISIGWAQAKVKCDACGHVLPWYHHTFQELHKTRCKGAS